MAFSLPGEASSSSCALTEVDACVHSVIAFDRRSGPAIPAQIEYLGLLLYADRAKSDSAAKQILLHLDGQREGQFKFILKDGMSAAQVLLPFSLPDGFSSSQAADS